MVYVVLLYGDGWAFLLEKMASRLHQLQIQQPLLVIAIGKGAAEACDSLASKTNNERGSAKVICWKPATESQVHRFTGINALLHLGVDVIYVDMDTFFIRDPTHRILTGGLDKDAVFARHADADCLNIGVFYMRASGDTAIWMSQFIAWYHEHPFEVDQRGLHIFSGLPSEKLAVAYLPEDIVEIKAGVLDDINEVVIGSIGWSGTLHRMLIFHWCQRPLEEKKQELINSYDAASSLQPHNMPLALALSIASDSIEVGQLTASPWREVAVLKTILMKYRKDQLPAREPCW
eukprot:TRINITY_DN11316_c0_g1_i1.p1 TRINITY_DN11316_c0_g1~~TRINITY_DN11316_c0_g1_i1.p1  ORF type:complete len:290 (-),score=56.62 TRINITY_DN11316_c0_g1_i1:103-972(-)